MQATDFGSTSNDTTVAPSLRAASENNPLPEPMSRKRRPASSVPAPSMAESERAASAIRGSETMRRNLSQFSPKAKRSSPLIALSRDRPRMPWPGRG